MPEGDNMLVNPEIEKLNYGLVAEVRNRKGEPRHIHQLLAGSLEQETK